MGSTKGKLPPEGELVTLGTQEGFLRQVVDWTAYDLAGNEAEIAWPPGPYDQ